MDHRINPYYNGQNIQEPSQLRIGLLATKENCNRVRDVEKSCRHYHRVNESLQHLVQHCHFSHFPRMQRYDAVCRLLQQDAERKGHLVLWEPVITTRTGRLKPDIIIVTREKICVVDISIVTEHMKFGHMRGESKLSDISNFKSQYYNREELKDHLKDIYHLDQFYFGVIIISLRGMV